MSNEMKLFSYKSKSTGALCLVYKGRLVDDEMMTAMLGDGFKIENGVRYAVSQFKKAKEFKHESAPDGGFVYTSVMKPIKKDHDCIVHDFTDEDFKFKYLPCTQEQLEKYYEEVANND